MTFHQYPPGIIGLSLYHARQRIQANRERYNGNPEKERGGIVSSVVFGTISRELWTDAIGILGEMLVRSQVDLSGRHDHYTAGTFVSPRPNDAADLIVGQSRIAIKASEDGVPKVNRKAHFYGNCTHYTFVHLRSDGYSASHYTRNDVDSWRVVDGPFSQYLTP